MKKYISEQYIDKIIPRSELLNKYNMMQRIDDDDILRYIGGKQNYLGVSQELPKLSPKQIYGNTAHIKMKSINNLTPKEFEQLNNEMYNIRDLLGVWSNITTDKLMNDDERGNNLGDNY